MQFLPPARTTQPRAEQLGSSRFCRAPLFVRTLLCLLVLVGFGFSSAAQAAPEARLLRVDSETSLEEGNPVLTTLIDLYDHKNPALAAARCSQEDGDKRYDCLSQAFEKEGVWGSPLPFPEGRLQLGVKIGERLEATRYLDHQTFAGASGNAATAWLVAIDGDERTGKAFSAAVALARTLLSSLGPNDTIKFVALGERSPSAQTEWLSAAQTKEANEFLDGLACEKRADARNRPLFSLLESTAKEGFSSLADLPKPPLHQAYLVISNGYGGGDPLTSGSGAAQLSQALTRGRFDENNTQIPRLPVPVVSVFIPPTIRRDSAMMLTQKAALDESALAYEFMQGLSNPKIGGFFTVLRPSQEDQARRIIDRAKQRFGSHYVVRYLAPCLAQASTQSFSLLVSGSNPAILGDESFKDVPVGFDPRDWPLTIDTQLTRETASAGITPGGTLKVFGDFCWENDSSRPEAYFISAGESLPPRQAQKEAALALQKKLVALDLRAKATSAGRGFAEFQVPDSEQVLIGEGERAIVRVVIVDAQTHRMSGVAETNILQLPGKEKEVPRIFYLAFALAALLLLLGLILALRGAKKATPSVSAPQSSRSPYAQPAPTQSMPRPSTSPQPTPKSTRRVEVNCSEGKFTLLEGKNLKLGRDGSRCAAVLSHPQVSGFHATLRLKDGRLYIRDEGSTSGTRADGVLLEPGQWVELQDGDEVDLGPETLQLRIL